MTEGRRGLFWLLWMNLGHRSRDSQLEILKVFAHGGLLVNWYSWRKFWERELGCVQVLKKGGMQTRTQAGSRTQGSLNLMWTP